MSSDSPEGSQSLTHARTHARRARRAGAHGLRACTRLRMHECEQRAQRGDEELRRRRHERADLRSADGPPLRAHTRVRACVCVCVRVTVCVCVCVCACVRARARAARAHAGGKVGRGCRDSAELRLCGQQRVGDSLDARVRDRVDLPAIAYATGTVSHAAAWHAHRVRGPVAQRSPCQRYFDFQYQYCDFHTTNTAICPEVATFQEWGTKTPIAATSARTHPYCDYP